MARFDGYRVRIVAKLSQGSGPFEEYNALRIMPRDGEKRREWKLRPVEKRKALLATFASIFSESSARFALLHVSREALPVVTVFAFPRESLLNVSLRDVLQWSHLVQFQKKNSLREFFHIFINYLLLLFLSIIIKQFNLTTFYVYVF